MNRRRREGREVGRGGRETGGRGFGESGLGEGSERFQGRSRDLQIEDAAARTSLWSVLASKTSRGPRTRTYKLSPSYVVLGNSFA